MEIGDYKYNCNNSDEITNRKQYCAQEKKIKIKLKYKLFSQYSKRTSTANAIGQYNQRTHSKSIAS